MERYRQHQATTLNDAISPQGGEITPTWKEHIVPTIDMPTIEVTAIDVSAHSALVSSDDSPAGSGNIAAVAVEPVAATVLQGDAVQQLVKQVQQILHEMEQAVANHQWQRLRGLDNSMAERLLLLQQPQLAALKAKLQPLLEQRYQRMLDNITQQQASIGQKMQQHLQDKEGISAYRSLLDGQL